MMTNAHLIQLLKMAAEWGQTMDAAAKEAQDRIAALEAENRGLREALQRSGGPSPAK